MSLNPNSPTLTTKLHTAHLFHLLKPSNLESLIERFIVTQTKTNKALGESVNQLNSKFDVMASY